MPVEEIDEWLDAVGTACQLEARDIRLQPDDNATISSRDRQLQTTEAQKSRDHYQYSYHLIILIGGRKRNQGTPRAGCHYIWQAYEWLHQDTNPVLD